METQQRLTPQPQASSDQSPPHIDPQLISQQRVQYIVDSYTLTGSDTEAFEAYLDALFNQYPYGLIELALVETLVKSWLAIPMEKGLPFLSTAHEQLKQWQQSASILKLTPSQFFQITNLDPQHAFEALAQNKHLSVPSTAD